MNSKSQNKKNNALSGAGEWVTSKAQPMDWVKITQEVNATEIDPSEYVLPRATLPVLIASSTKLMAQLPEKMSEAVIAAHGQMVEARDMARVHRATDAGIGGRDAQTPRFEVLRCMTVIEGGVANFASLDVQGAAELHGKVFGAMKPLRNLPGPLFWEEVEGVRIRLESEPGLRKQLDALIPGGLVERMLEAHGRLGWALGMTASTGMPSMLTGVIVTAFLRRKVMAYVVQVLASANGSPLALQKATAALEPVRELRAAQRRARKGEVAEEEEEVDEVELAEPATTAPVVEPAAPDGG